MKKFNSKAIPIFVALIVMMFASNVLAQRNQLNDLLRQSSQLNIQAEKKNPSSLKIARLHYSGGGDWYWGRSAIPNMLKCAYDNSDLRIDTIEHEITINDPELFKYPFLFATGHGLISFEADEIERLRLYLSNGGFLFVNDSYGMEKTFLKEMAKIFPEREIVELPFTHPLYHSFYDFPYGPPKIHEHDNNPPRGYAIIVNSKAVVYFLVESDIGDGWEDTVVHNDSDEKRLESFQMGLNLITYALLY